jgi:alkyldihydroxyacetonephosphate synthase
LSTLSRWHWGVHERYPSRAAREAMADQLGAILGLTGLEAREPLEPRLPQRRVEVDLPWASTEDRERMLHARGKAFPDQLAGFEGDFSTAPDAVLTPSSEEELERSLAWASERKVAVVPFGGGTSVVGGVTCKGAHHEGVISLDLAGLSGVREVDPVSLSARIGAGTKGPELERALAREGLTLRHFPQSFEHSTLGGWIATRAGGHFATGPTHIDDLVESTRMITPTGTWASRRLPASGAGPSPDRLVLGSEGSLGVITEAWMRVRPRPRYRSKCSLRFARFSDGVQAVRGVVQSGLLPSNLRLLDGREARLHQVGFDGASVLLLGFESAHHPQQALLELALGIARERGGEADQAVHSDSGQRARDSKGDSWRQAFFDGPYLQSALLSLGAVVDTFETATTWDRFAALHEDVIASVRAALGRPCFVSCRFTHAYPDGPAPYYTFIAPGPHGAQLSRWMAAKEAASEALMRHGATITHHHAVGRMHEPWYRRQRPEPFARALAAMKRELDPAGILNPGVLLPEGQPGAGPRRPPGSPR